MHTPAKCPATTTALSDIWRQPSAISTTMLTDEQKQALVEIARQSVSDRVSGRLAPSRASRLAAGVWCFVTLKAGGHLRGCLGTLDSLSDLGREVARCAGDAATEDPRFRPVSVPEIPELSIEVSVLGPLEQIDPSDPGVIAIGRHGLVVEQGRNRGVLLPQVAAEWQWTREQFLQQTCVKANLAPDAWRRGATVYRFVAEVFGR
jgi:AmmeMemoRadiSam system protein A